MMRSLYTGATGMVAQQLNIDVISNNLANVNTTGFKKSRAEFEDLMYQTMKIAGSITEGDNRCPVGIQVGMGVAGPRPCTSSSPRATSRIRATPWTWPLKATAFSRWM